MKSSSDDRINNKSLIENYTFVISLICSFFVTVLALFLISLIPVNTDVTKYSELVVPSLLKYCKPEPLEMPQYATAIVLMPASFLGAYNLFLKRSESLNRVSLYRIFEATFILIVVIISFFSFLMVYDYVPEYFYISNYHLIICFFITLFLYFIFKKTNSLERKSTITAFYILTWLAVIVYGFYKTATINYMMQDSQYVQHHFYAWWYPVYKVYSGQTIGVDFNNIYGFYPYIVVPLLKLLGGVKQSSVSVLFALILCFIATSYFAFCYRFIKNKLFALIVALSASVYGPFSVLGDNANNPKIYFQYQPTRTLFIAVCLFAVSIYTAVKSKKAKAAIKLIMIPVLGIGLMWNLEMGMVSMVIWAGFYILESAVKNTLFDKKTVYQVIKAILSSVCSMVLWVIIVEFITYSRTGCLIGKNAFLFGIICFEGTGFFMIPLMLGTWIPIWIPFMAGVIVSIPYLIGNKPVCKITENSLTGIFIIAISGLGAFVYFMGRSVPTNDFAYLPYSAISYALLFEYYGARIKVYKKEQENKELNSVITFEKVKGFLCIFMVSLVLLLSAMYIINSAKPEYKNYHNSGNSSDLIVNKTAQDIKDWADENNDGQFPNMLVFYNAYISEALGKPSTETVCEQIDWFLRDNVYSYVTYINEHRNESFVINENAVNNLEECFPDEWNEILEHYSLSEVKKEFDNEHKYKNFYFYVPNN